MTSIQFGLCTLNKALLLNHLKITIINYLVASKINIQLKMKLTVFLKQFNESLNTEVYFLNY